MYLAKIGGMEKLRTKVELMKARFFTEEEIEKEKAEMRNLSIVHELQSPKRGRPPKKKISKKQSEYYIGVGICCGVLIGTLIGVRTDNLGVWISLGTVFGLIFGVMMQKRNSNN